MFATTPVRLPTYPYCIGVQRAIFFMEEMKDKELPTAVFVKKSLVLNIFWEPKSFPSSVTVKLNKMKVETLEKETTESE